MTDRDLAFMPAWKQAAMIARRAISPVELVELYLERIDRIDPRLHAYITVAAQYAVDAAREAEAKVIRGDPLGPLHGVPISLKDIEATQGIRTTLGSLVFKDTVPERDSVVAGRVRASGAIILGKTSTPEIAIHLETVTDNALVGPCRNPWRLDRTTGGSSGGAAAALAAGLCPLAVGTDGGGSIRIPASFCGVFGFKPSQGRVPRAGGLGKPDPNQFAQSGPMSNDVRDSALLLEVLSGPDRRDPQPYLRESPPAFIPDLDRPLAGLRVGWSKDFGHSAVDPEVEKAAHSAALTFERLGCRVEEAFVSLSPSLSDHFWNVFGANAYLQYGHLLDERRDLLGESARTALERGKAIAGHQYARSLRAVNELRVYMDEVMTRYDLLLTPTTSITAFDPKNRPTHIAGKEVNSITGFYPYTFPINMTGQPAATVPCGFVEGLPVGLHIIGRFKEDGLVLRAAAAFEAARPWSHRRPSIAG
ncbi:MAG: amidase [Chloroflexi bacterium]|nr:amidase [Chloroflexota bacterium]